MRITRRRGPADLDADAPVVHVGGIGDAGDAARAVVLDLHPRIDLRLVGDDLTQGMDEHDGHFGTIQAHGTRIHHTHIEDPRAAVVAVGLDPQRIAYGQFVGEKLREEVRSTIVITTHQDTLEAVRPHPQSDARILQSTGIHGAHHHVAGSGYRHLVPYIATCIVGTAWIDPRAKRCGVISGRAGTSIDGQSCTGHTARHRHQRTIAHAGEHLPRCRCGAIGEDDVAPLIIEHVAVLLFPILRRVDQGQRIAVAHCEGDAAARALGRECADAAAVDEHFHGTSVPTIAVGVAHLQDVVTTLGGRLDRGQCEECKWNEPGVHV